jgi:phosphatidylethanolamine/phosphatidyl-N-methylethanolamine N-methyltransferase
VLEVGVGTGLSLDLYPPDVRVTGIDVSREMLEKARRRVAKRKLTHVEALLEMDAEAMTFAAQSFDKVVAMYVLPVVPNPGRLLAELHRVCKPTGEIYLVNHVRSDNPVIGAVEKGLARFSDKLGFHPDFELRELLHESHELVQIERVNLFWKVMQLRNGVASRKL